MSYKCIRCRQERDIPGFCQDCYLELYGLKNEEPGEINMEDLICNPMSLELVERDKEYTREICESIKKDGLKNPIIINEKGNILIGHHRYYIYKELGFTHIPCYLVKDNGSYNKFIEGESNNLFVLKIDGKLMASVTNVEQFLPFIRRWISATPQWKTSYMNIECFTGIGASNYHEEHRS